MRSPQILSLFEKILRASGNRVWTSLYWTYSPIQEIDSTEDEYARDILGLLLEGCVKIGNRFGKLLVVSAEVESPHSL